MITITNGQMTLTIPRSAYDTHYKASGFHPLKDEDSPNISADTFPTLVENEAQEGNYDEENPDLETVDDTDSDDTESDEEEVDLSEIPLREMDFYQLSAYADQLGLDHRGIRSKRELRALIKNNM